MFGLRHLGDDVEDGIAISLKPEDRPKWKRCYVTTIRGDDGRVLKMSVELQCIVGTHRSDWSELRQDNGKYVIFELHAPADKILDRSIIGAVDAACQKIIALDRAFMANVPPSFVDESHTTWQRL